jgi:hypothetical protein
VGQYVSDLFREIVLIQYRLWLGAELLRIGVGGLAWVTGVVAMRIEQSCRLVAQELRLFALAAGSRLCCS